MHCIRCALIGLMITGTAYSAELAEESVAISVSKVGRTIVLKDAAEFTKYSELTAEKDAVDYNTKTNEMTFEVSEVTGQGWRLVHDGKRVVMLDYHDGVTSSVHTIFTAETLKECTAEIKRLGLTITDETMEAAEHEAEKSNTVGAVATEPIGDISKTQ